MKKITALLFALLLFWTVNVTVRADDVTVTDRGGTIITIGEIAIGKAGDGALNVTRDQNGNPIIIPGKTTEKIGMTLVIDGDGIVSVSEVKDTTMAGSGTSDKRKKSAGDSPKTGDDSRPWLWFLCMLLTWCGLTAIMICGKKRKDNRK